MRKLSRATARGGVIVTAVAGVIALSVLPASAHPIYNYSWRNADTICASCSVSRGNIVGLWQNILWAEGFMSKCTSNSTNGIDGYFGSKTKAATISFQRRYGLTADGVVGPNTWAKAQSRLHGPWYDTGAAKFYSYTGQSGSRTVGEIKYVYTSNTNIDHHNSWEFTSESNPGQANIWTNHPAIDFYEC